MKPQTLLDGLNKLDNEVLSNPRKPVSEIRGK